MKISTRALPILLGISLFVLAAGVRLTLVSTARFSDDEADFFQMGRGIVAGKFFPELGTPLTGGRARNPGPLLYYVAALGQLGGPWPEAQNGMMALLGALAVVFVWWALRTEFSLFAASFSAVALAVAPWHVLYSEHLSNVPLLGFFSAVTLWATMKVRRKSSSPWIALVVLFAALMPQLHLSCPILWVAFAYLLKDHFAKVSVRWAILGGVAAGICYLPYVHHELTTNFSNLANYSNERSSGMRGRAFLPVPLYLLRFLTLDTSDFEMAGYWETYSQPEALRAAFGGTAVRPFHPLRLFALIVSLGLAGVAWVAAFRKPDARARDYRNAVLWAVGADVALLAIGGKSDFYSHYVQPLVYFPFLLLSAAVVRWEKYRRYFVAALLVFVIGATESVQTISRRLDAKNGLGVQRTVLAKMVSENSPVELKFGFRSSLPPYVVLSRELYGRELAFSNNAFRRYFLADDNSVVPEGFTGEEKVGPVRIFRTGGH